MKTYLYLLLMTLLVIGLEANASDMVKGQASFERYCANCHGNGNRGIMPAADFSKGEGLFQSDQRLVARIEKGKNACPSFRGILKEQDIYDLVAYIRTLY